MYRWLLIALVALGVGSVPRRAALAHSVAICVAFPADLQGKWTGGKCPGQGRGPCIQKTYTFRAHDYVMVGYPQLRVEGRICLLDRRNVSPYRVRFYDRYMVDRQKTKWPNVDHVMVVSPDRKTITLDGFTLHRAP